MDGLEEGAGFDRYSIEMADFEVKKKKNYHYSFWLCTEGGSIDNKPLIHNGMIFLGPLITISTLLIF